MTKFFQTPCVTSIPGTFYMGVINKEKCAHNFFSERMKHAEEKLGIYQSIKREKDEVVEF